MKYLLESPEAKGKKLIQTGQLDCMPIYQCKATNTFWILKMKMSGERSLHKYDPSSGTVDPAQSAEVDQKWEGDPQTIGIDSTTWQDFKHPDYAQNLEGIKGLMNNGDFVCLIDDKRRVTHLLVLDDEGGITLQPLTVV